MVKERDVLIRIDAFDFDGRMRVGIETKSGNECSRDAIPISRGELDQLIRYEEECSK